MSAVDEIRRFAEAVVSDASLRQDVTALGSDPQAIVRLANSRGYSFSMDDVNKLGGSGELSEDGLDNVVGGMTTFFEAARTTLYSGGDIGLFTTGIQKLVRF